jgi:type I restriction enzyme S subunit
MNAETFMANFGHLADAPGGVAKLRQMVLQLAVQGKLVEQNPSDEPASELLKRIAAEKERLIEEKKIRKPKALPPIEVDEVPFDVPSGWKWSRLGNLTEIQTGKKDVNEGHKNGLHPFFSCAAKPLRSNDFSFNCEALLLPGNGANVGMVTHFVGKFEAYQRTYIVSGFFGISARYIGTNLEARFLDAITGKQFGSAINYIKLGNLTEFAVPLPPLAEQKRIVAKVDQLLSQCAELSARLGERRNATQELLISIIHHLLNDAES